MPSPFPERQTVQQVERVGKTPVPKVVSVYCSMLLLQSRGGLIYEGASSDVIKFKLDIDTNHHFCHVGDNKKV